MNLQRYDFDELTKHECDDGEWVKADEAEAEIARLNEECETWRIQLAACGVAALSNTHESIKDRRLETSNPYYSASYSDVCDAVDREIALREDNERKDAEIARLRKVLEYIEEQAMLLDLHGIKRQCREALEDGK